jgi:alpha-acetolactate decarboxylase
VIGRLATEAMQSSDLSKRIHSSSPIYAFALAICMLFASCSSTPKKQPDTRLRSWGTMREVLREGKTRARVNLSHVARKGTWGVGALASLEGEITIIDGKASLAVVKDGKHTHRKLSKKDVATLLVLAEVERWDEQPLVEARTLKDLERVLESAIARSAFRSGKQPVPIRIEGRLDDLAIHVIQGACPVASPDGPAPWRWHGRTDHGTLVGIYCEGSEGKLTHHSSRMHLHAVFKTESGQTLSGHVDDVALGEGVRLYLPSLGQ